MTPVEAESQQCMDVNSDGAESDSASQHLADVASDRDSDAASVVGQHLSSPVASEPSLEEPAEQPPERTLVSLPGVLQLSRTGWAEAKCHFCTSYVVGICSDLKCGEFVCMDHWVTVCEVCAMALHCKHEEGICGTCSALLVEAVLSSRVQQRALGYDLLPMQYFWPPASRVG